MTERDVIRCKLDSLSRDIFTLKAACLRTEPALRGIYRCPETGEVLSDRKALRRVASGEIPEKNENGERWFRVWKRSFVRYTKVVEHINPKHARWGTYQRLKKQACAWHDAITLFNATKDGKTPSDVDRVVPTKAREQRARTLIRRVRKKLEKGVKFDEVRAWLETKRRQSNPHSESKVTA